MEIDQKEKESMIQSIDEMIDGLQSIKAKISRDEPVENDDWVVVAVSLRENINYFGNYTSKLKNV